MINILLYQIAAYTMHWKILKSHNKLINLNHQFQNGIKNLNYWWIIFLSRYSRLFSVEEKTDNPSIKIYVNKIEIEVRLK